MKSTVLASYLRPPCFLLPFRRSDGHHTQCRQRASETGASLRVHRPGEAGRRLVEIIGANPIGSCFLIALAGMLCPVKSALAQSVIVSPTTIDLGTYVSGSGTALPTQTVMVTSSGAQLTFAASITGGNGIHISYISVPGSPPMTPDTITVHPMPTTYLDTVTPGDYTDTYSVGGVMANTVTFTVSMTIAPKAPPPTPTIAMSPTSAQLVAPVCPAPANPAAVKGSLVPHDTTPVGDTCDDATLNMTISSTNNQDVPVTFATSNSALIVTPNNSIVPADGTLVITAIYNPEGASEGSSTATITATPQTGPSETAQVQLTTTSETIVSSSSDSLTFNPQQNGTTAPESVNFYGTGPPVPFQVQSSPGSSDPCPTNSVNFSPTSGILAGQTTIVASLDPSVPIPVSCSVVLETTFNGAFNSAFTTLVSVNVAPKPTLNYSASEGLADYVPAGTPISLYTSDGSAVQFFLSVPQVLTASYDSSVTPARLVISATAAANALSPGTYVYPVKVSTNGATTNTVSIGIKLVVGGSQVSATPPAVSVAVPPSVSVLLPQTLQISGTSSGTFNVYSYPANLLSGLPSTLTVPNGGAVNLPFTLDISAITGNGSGVISLVPEGGSTSALDALVTSYVPSTPVVSPVRETIDFDYYGSTTKFFRADVPLSNVNVSVKTDDGGNWATPSPVTVNFLGNWTPTAVGIQFNTTGLLPGAHAGTLTLSTANGTSLLSRPFAWISKSETSLTARAMAEQYIALIIGSNSTKQSRQDPEFPRASTGNTIPSQTIDLPGSGQSYSTIGPGWLTISPASGTTPQTLTISGNASVLSTLGPGSYVGEVAIAIASVPDLVTIPVNLVIGIAPAVAAVNAASGQSDAVSPGEIVSIFGSNIGPATALGLALTSTGSVSTSLGNTQVLFDGVPAPLTYAGSGQINAIVPYEVGGKQFTTVTIQSNGTTTGETVLGVHDSDPAIFAVQSGTGQGAILNQDNSYNSASNPAAAGSVITFYATGEGPLAPTVPTGSVTSSTGPMFPAPVGPVSVTIGGQPASIIYAGEAPGFASGVFQVDATIPAGTSSGAQQIVLAVGNNDNAAQNITVAVK